MFLLIKSRVVVSSQLRRRNS